MNFSVFFKLLTYMGDGSIISAIAVPPCSEPVPIRICWVLLRACYKVNSNIRYD